MSSLRRQSSSLTATFKNTGNAVKQPQALITASQGERQRLEDTLHVHIVSQVELGNND